MPTATLEQAESATVGQLRFSVPQSPNDMSCEEASAVLPTHDSRPVETGPEASLTEHSTKHPAAVEEDDSPLIRLSSGRAPWRRFKLLQQWEGVVTEVAGDSVHADLCDLTNLSNAVEVVEIPLAEISEADQPLLEAGSVFYWCIGYERSPGGQIRRVSEIRVRRTPTWSRHAVQSVATKAEELFERFGGNGEALPTTIR